ncbi:MAG: peroxide stress protein YaaA [Planctomycetota bacterium]|nr:MAG: peroxide stress protein YaaA [Planctomycetota bacterium]
MLLVISPAKKLDFASSPKTKLATQPEFLDEAEALIGELRKLSSEDIAALMNLSEKLGDLNYERFQQWQRPMQAPQAKQAILAFNGDVYSAMQASEFDAASLDFAQKHLRILSGLYGLLRPMDLIAPYRLEMGTRLATPRGRDLYAFWGDSLCTAIKQQLAANNDEVLVNLASNEYFKAARPKAIQSRIITPVFKDQKGNKYKVISFYAKKARGLMCRYVISHRLKNVEQLKQFNSSGYAFNEAMSSANEWTFTREEGAGD